MRATAARPLLAALVLVAPAACRRAAEAPPSPALETAAAGSPARRLPGRPPAPPDAGWLAAARNRMRDPVEESCGPYRLVSDSEDRNLKALCGRIASRLDQVYRERFGLDPPGEPAGAVLLFARREDFRRFATEIAGLATGYAGFSRAARGVVALPADETLFAATLAHELTHLVNRRTLGPGLAPWLSEGLSDAIGDAAGERGLEELTGLRGAEGQARRLALAYEGGLVRGLSRLAALRRGDFDRGVPSYDYEQSALAVRMMLLDDELAPGFRRYLAALAAGEPDAPDLLPQKLGVGWQELDRRLERWLADGLATSRVGTL